MAEPPHCDHDNDYNDENVKVPLEQAVEVCWVVRCQGFHIP